MKLLDGQTIGIDLGTTYSSLAQLDNEGKPISIPNADGKTTTPSVVLLGESGHVIVGPSPERISVEAPDNVVEAIKRQMGNKNWHKVYQGKKLTPEFISALILKKLKQDSEQHIGTIGNAVITVPYYFNDMRRKATQDAGRIAGLNVIDIINEPTAATLTVAVSRGDFQRMTADLLQRTRDTTELVLQQSGVEIGALDEVVLVGGSTHMPAVYDMLKAVTGRPPSRELNPDEAVAEGAAIHAAILEARETGGESRMAQAVIKRLRAVTATDVNSHSLGIEITDDVDKKLKSNH